MVDVLYDDIAKAIRQVKCPVKSLTVDIATHPDYLALRIYEEQVMEYGINDREAIMQYLLLMRDIVQSYGVRCEIEGVKYVPKRK